MLLMLRAPQDKFDLWPWLLGIGQGSPAGVWPNARNFPTKCVAVGPGKRFPESDVGSLAGQKVWIPGHRPLRHSLRALRWQSDRGQWHFWQREERQPLLGCLFVYAGIIDVADGPDASLDSEEFSDEHICINPLMIDLAAGGNRMVDLLQRKAPLPLFDESGGNLIDLCWPVGEDDEARLECLRGFGAAPPASRQTRIGKWLAASPWCWLPFAYLDRRGGRFVLAPRDEQGCSGQDRWIPPPVEDGASSPREQLLDGWAAQALGLAIGAQEPGYRVMPRPDFYAILRSFLAQGISAAEQELDDLRRRRLPQSSILLQMPSRPTCLRDVDDWPADHDFIDLIRSNLFGEELWDSFLRGSAVPEPPEVWSLGRSVWLSWYTAAEFSWRREQPAPWSVVRASLLGHTPLGESFALGGQGGRSAVHFSPRIAWNAAVQNTEPAAAASV